MLQRTKERMIKAFRENRGYMSFAQLQDRGVTVLQLQEMEEAGILEKFARGWYWCNTCGFKKPDDHKYVEIAKVNPDAVICMESAAYLAGLIREEPEIVHVATERTDRKKMEFSFPVKRYYFKNTGIKGEIAEKKTGYGSYHYYAPERTFCDCIRLKNKLSEENYAQILEAFAGQRNHCKRIYDYADRLRCVKNIQDVDKN